MSGHPVEDGQGEGTALPEAPATGEPRVDEALDGVRGLDELPVDEHAERLTAAHAALQEVLRSPSGP